MSTLLADLLKRSGGKKQPTEDFTTLCLAELMRRDRVAASIVVDALGLTEHLGTDLRWRTVRTQVTLAGTKQRPDLSLTVGPASAEKRVLIEVKVGAPPDRSQVARYAEISGCPVALLAPRHRLPSPTDPAWEGVPRGSWEDIAERLRAEERRHDAGHTPPLRADFLALLDALHLGGLRALSVDQMKAVRASMGRYPELRAMVRGAVEALLPRESGFQVHPSNADSATVGDGAQWKHGGALDAQWRANKSPVDGLKGLSLSGWPSGAGETARLTWLLSAVPTAASAKRLGKTSFADGGWDKGHDGWWWRRLNTEGRFDGSLAQQLQQVVAEARKALHDELGIQTAKEGAPVVLVQPPSPVVLRGLHNELLAQQEAWQAVRAAKAYLLGSLEARLVARLGPKSVHRPKSRSARIELVRSRANNVMVGTHGWLEGEPGLMLWTSFGGKTRNETITPKFLATPWPGLAAKPGRNHHLDLVLSLATPWNGTSPLGRPALDAIVDGWMERFETHRALVLPAR